MMALAPAYTQCQLLLGDAHPHGDVAVQVESDGSQIQTTAVELCYQMEIKCHFSLYSGHIENNK